MKKRDKEVKRKQKQKKLQDIRFKGYYPEANIIEIKSGEFLELLRVRDIGEIRDRESYEAQLDLMIGGQKHIQFFHHKGKSYQVMRVQADLVDDAVEQFRVLLEKLNENTTFSYEQVSLGEWFDIICDFTREENFGGQIGVLKVSAKDALQPLQRKVTSDYLELGERVSKTFILTGLPSEMFTGFMTELLCISERISSSVYIDKINIGHCQMALDTVTDMYEVKKQVLEKFMETLVKREENLYSVCALVHIDGLVGEVERLYERVEELCRNYLVSVNPLEQQQLQGFLSVLPLDDNLIRVYRAITGKNVRSLLDFSWMKLLHSGFCYGISAVSGKELYFHRGMDRSSGFYLGRKSKADVRAEINWMLKTERVAVFTLGQAKRDSNNFCGVSGNRILCEDATINREILRAIFYMKNGNHGNVSERLKGILSKVLLEDSNVMSYESFLVALEKINMEVAKKMTEPSLVALMNQTGQIEQTEQLGVYKPLASTKTEELIQLYGAIANCKEDIIYILNGEVFGGLSDNRFLGEIMKQTGKMVTVCSTDDMVMLRNGVFKEIMRESGFIHISTCDTLEKVNVAAVLGLTKNQKLHIQREGNCLLLTQYADYLVRKEEEENE